MTPLQEQVQQLSQETAGKVVAGIGGAGTTVQIITEWANLFVAIGNGVLVAIGLYLVYHKLWKRNKRRDRRSTDSGG